MEQKDQFEWIPFYQELADKISEYQHNRTGLVLKIGEAFENAGMKLPDLASGGELPEEIDPFTVFTLFNRTIHPENRRLIAEKIGEVFKVKANPPKDFSEIPSLNNKDGVFYKLADANNEEDQNRLKNEIQSCWNLFEAALDLSKQDNPENWKRFVESFDAVQKAEGVGISKTTILLFYLRPESYLPLDYRTHGFIQGNWQDSNQLRKENVRNLNNLDGKEYLRVRNLVLDLLKDSAVSAHSLPELVKEARRDSKVDIDVDVEQPNFWLYSPGEQAFLWNECLSGQDMVIGYGEIGNPAGLTKAQIAERLKERGASDTQSLSQATTVYDFLNVMKPGDTVFAKKGRKTILGKGIVGDKVWFQEDEPNEYKNFRSVKWIPTEPFEIDATGPIKTLTRITDRLGLISMINSHFDEVPGGDDPGNDGQYPPYSEQDFRQEVYMSEQEYSILKSLILEKQNVILEGAPGVGKTFVAKRLAYSIMGLKDPERVLMVQFHQSYSYEDFVIGYRPTSTGFELKEGPFYEFCMKAEEDSENDYFVIIDEMNRGNLNRIFGELFMLMEKDKRGEKIRMLYGDRLFSIPKNIYFIGLMNTADRSLASLDYALRRRFYFFQITPKYDSEGFQNYLEQVDDRRLERLVAVVKKLNEEIEEDPTLGEGFQIGHSYLSSLNPDKISNGALERIVNYELVPLLTEYWYEEPSKIKEWSKTLKDAVAADDTDS